MNWTILFLLTSIFLGGNMISYVSPASAESSYYDLMETAINDLDSFSGNEYLSKPTFGESHLNGQIIVYDGFVLNNQTFTITNNFHTPFAEQSIKLGEMNSFEATVYSPKGLKVQEFLFGIPEIGEAHLSELGVEVWYGINGEIEGVRAIQKSNIIDKESIVATHEKTKCKSTDVKEHCDTTSISVMFFEPLKDKVMALKAIDYNNRYHITYLNEGLDISDSSLNPMDTRMILPLIKGEGFIKVTQMEKYSSYWLAKDGRMFEKNDFGSFKQINISFKRFQDSGIPLTRDHSEFGGVLQYEKQRALNVFNSTTLVSELPDSFAYVFPELDERINDKIKMKMTEQEQIAKNVLEDSQVQARYSKHSRG
jgi:hypothetical protein